MRLSTFLRMLSVALLLFSGIFNASAASPACTPSGTTVQSGSWHKVRHLLPKGKAKCFESKCNITWQLFRETSCSKRIIKRDCQERNVQIVDAKVSR